MAPEFGNFLLNLSRGRLVGCGVIIGRRGRGFSGGVGEKRRRTLRDVNFLFALFVFDDRLAAVEGVGDFEIARDVLAGRAHRVFGFEKLFEVFALDVMTLAETGDSDVELHLRHGECERTARQPGDLLSEASCFASCSKCASALSRCFCAARLL